MAWFVQVRELHQRVAPLVLLPLLITVLSGVSYRLARIGLALDAISALAHGGARG